MVLSAFDVLMTVLRWAKVSVVGRCPSPVPRCWSAHGAAPGEGDPQVQALEAHLAEQVCGYREALEQFCREFPNCPLCEEEGAP
jgi:hypothetical protein